MAAGHTLPHVAQRLSCRRAGTRTIARWRAMRESSGSRKPMGKLCLPFSADTCPLAMPTIESAMHSNALSTVGLSELSRAFPSGVSMEPSQDCEKHEKGTHRAPEMRQPDTYSCDSVPDREHADEGWSEDSITSCHDSCATSCRALAGASDTRGTPLNSRRLKRLAVVALLLALP